MFRFLSRAPSVRLLILLGVLLVPFAAHGQAPSMAPRQDVSLRLDWVPTWYHGVFYLALNRGYYSDAGLNMTIGQGRGSATTAQVVGSGTETFGLMDMSTMMLAISTGAPPPRTALRSQSLAWLRWMPARKSPSCSPKG